MFSPPLIRYFIVHPEGRRSKTTQFQYFNFSWLSLLDTLTASLQGPTSIPDLVNPYPERVSTRGLGIVPFWFGVVDPTELQMETPWRFMVIVTTKETDDIGRAYSARYAGVPILHLLSNPQSNEIGLTDAGDNVFRKWWTDVEAYLAREEPAVAMNIGEYVDEMRTRKTQPHSADPRVFLRATFLTMPNDLRSLSGILCVRHRMRRSYAPQTEG